MKALGSVISAISVISLGFGLLMIVSLNSDARAPSFGEEKRFTVSHFLVPGFFGLVMGIAIVVSATVKKQSEETKKEEAEKEKRLEGFRRIE